MFRLCVAIVASLVMIPIAGTFSVPAETTYLQVPGALILVLNGAIGLWCFLSCPRNPILLKSLMFLIAVATLYLALRGIGHCVLYLDRPC